MIIKPLPSSLPITPNANPTQPWSEYFGSLDQTVRAGSSFPDSPNVVTSGAGVVLTGPQLLAGVLFRAGAPGVFSDQTPTASEIVNEMPKAPIATNRLILIGNTGGGLMTLVAGSGVTLQGPTTIAAGYGRLFLVTLTAIAPGAQAATLLGLITASF